MTRRGTLIVERFASRRLAGNRLGDPHVRKLLVYLPPGYAESGRRYPTVMLLPGYTGRSTSWVDPRKVHRPIGEVLERAIQDGAPPAILVMPDAWTRYGGSQYVNSALNGPYEDYLTREIVPHVDRTYRTLAERAHRAVMGKSSGGYGALVLAMRHPDLFGAAACHSGDLHFEITHKPLLAAFVDAVGRRLPAAGRTPRSHDVQYLFGLSAAYSPNLRSTPYGFDLPCRLGTAEIVPSVWKRWLANDPLTLLPRHAAALRRLRLLYLDCGSKDEFHLHLGARLFAERARRLGIRVRHEEFDGGHFKISHRYERSLPLVLRAIA